MNDFNRVRASFNRIVKSELEYRGLSVSADEVLIDTIRAGLCIASRGQFNREEYPYYKDGISRIRNHIMGGRFNGEKAGACASRVLYLASALLSRQDAVIKINDPNVYSDERIELPKPKSFSYLRIVDPIAYGYAAEAGKIIRIIDVSE